ncbi:HD-GYP domain-containing protein [Geobacillus subterraneus]|uniref:HD-GYP domain-containing protein n=1 Tax=Geobacillus subterraneus TaxID=129338 RepID=UPI001442DAA5|nr:HD-GYP domain-containing protein [Geobacillus subterraneus]QIZ66231.1 HD-GYP domain-containing protein [Geobacillus subterraneus]
MVRVKLNQLCEGCVLAEDVLGKTKKPIMLKNTVITKSLLHVLSKFLIDEVEVEPVLVNGEPFLGGDPSLTKPDERPVMLYLEAVQQYKRVFQSWQSGLPVDIREIREIAIPLFNKMIKHKRELLVLHHYTTKEEYLYHHAVSVGLLAGFLAMQLGYGQGECHQIVLAGVLSDCGMAKISSQILLKPSALTEAEFREIEQHPIFGYRMVQKIAALNQGAKLAVLQHHERNDGSGYPLRVKAEKIHPYGQIIAVADVYYAMTSERLYRRKQSPLRVIETMQREQAGRLNTEVVALLFNHLVSLQTGTMVKLSNGETAEVVFTQRDEPLRPIVKVIETEELLPLAEHRDLYIEEILSP